MLFLFKQSNDALEMKLKEQEKQLRLAEKEKRALEKDIKKFMKAEAKQGKQEDNERTKRLLKITVREVRWNTCQVGTN